MGCCSSKSVGTTAYSRQMSISMQFPPDIFGKLVSPPFLVEEQEGLYTNTRCLYIKDKNLHLRFLIDTGTEVSGIPRSGNTYLKQSMTNLLAGYNTEINIYDKKLLTLDTGLHR